MPDGIALNLVNESNEQNDSPVVIFQKNVVQEFGGIAVAWQVIQNLGVGDHHPFVFSFDLQANAVDSYGNVTPRFPIKPGQAYQMVLANSGDVLQLYPPGAGSPDEMDVRNDMPTTQMAANIYRSGKLLAVKSLVAPGQKAVFKFDSNIFIGVVSKADEGKVMDAAPPAQTNTELSLLGVRSADIVMKGGGPNAKPCEFSLRHVKYA